MLTTRSHFRAAWVSAAVAAMFLVTGCSAATPKPPPASDSSPGGWKNWDGKSWEGSGDGSAGKDAGSSRPTAAPALTTSSATETKPVSGAPPVVVPEQQGPPRAGMVDDNADFAAYLKYTDAYQGAPVHRVDVAGRRFIRVIDRENRPVADAAVTVTLAGQGGISKLLFSGRTYSDGRVAFYPTGRSTDEFRVTVNRDGFAKEETVHLGAGGTATVVLDQVNTSQEPVRLDLLFLLDATGSMGDEIAQLKRSIDSIAARVDALGQPKPLTRYGMVVYRDRGDEFVTRTFDFTDDVKRFAGALEQVQAGGGGDGPESLNEALHEAVNGVNWRMDTHTVRLIFLVADAPPHLDYEQDYDYATLMPEAAAKGIKISAIAASGLDPQGEYIYRQLAQYTLGRFVFLTYANGVSGAPGDKTVHNVQQFRVENLDDLIVKLVTDEVRPQTAQP